MVAMAILLLPTAAWLLTLVLTSLYAFQRITAARRRLPPGPWPLPLIGNLLAIGSSSPHRSLARLAERYGPLMSVRLGVVHAVVVSSPAAAREIHQRHNAVLAARPVLDVWKGAGHLGNSVFALPPRDRWRALRKLATAGLMAPKKLDALRPLQREKVRELVHHVGEQSARGEPVDVESATFSTILCMLSHSMFSCNVFSGMWEGVIKEATVLATAPNVSDFFPAVAAADLQGLRRRMGKLIAQAYGIVDDQIVRRKRWRQAGEPRKDDLLDAVLDKEHEWQQDDNSVLDRDALKGLFTDMFAAGTDTTSTTVEWAMAELLGCPESMKKVKGELTRVLGTKEQVEEVDIDQLPYLQAVVKETLRLHPVAPMTFYRAEATVEIQGYTIPEGSTIILNIWALHRQADVWADADKFMPDRFLGKDINFFGMHPELIPFGGGRRICLGLPLAHRMVHLILASLLYHFDWKLPQGLDQADIDMTEKFGIVLCMATPLKAIATKSYHIL